MKSIIPYQILQLVQLRLRSRQIVMPRGVMRTSKLHDINVIVFSPVTLKAKGK